MHDYEGLPAPRRYWSVLAIWVVLTMAVLDGAIANVALPTIARDLAVSPANSVWVVNGFQLAVVVSLLPLAALGQMVGYRLVFLSGVALFTAASLGCALSQNLPELICARVIQGFGAGGVMSVSAALLRFTYPSHLLGRGIGFNALVVAAASAFGPSVASGILALGPWEWLFAVNVPVGIGALFLGRAALPSSPTGGAFDALSTVLSVAAFGLVFTGVDALTQDGAIVFGSIEAALGAGAAIALVMRSRALASPLIPIDLLRNRLFALSVVTSIASFCAQMLAFVSVPFYIQGVLRLGQVETGLLMTPWPVGTGVAALVAGRLSDRYPAAILGGAGLALLAFGLALLALMPAAPTAFDVAWRMGLCGIGFGFFQTPNNRVLLSSAPIARTGAAGGMLAVARLTGQTLGATLAAIALRYIANSEPAALGLAAAFAACAAAVSLTRLIEAPPRPPESRESMIAQTSRAA